MQYAFALAFLRAMKSGVSGVRIYDPFLRFLTAMKSGSAATAAKASGKLAKPKPSQRRGYHKTRSNTHRAIERDHGPRICKKRPLGSWVGTSLRRPLRYVRQILCSDYFFFWSYPFCAPVLRLNSSGLPKN